MTFITNMINLLQLGEGALGRLGETEMKRCKDVTDINVGLVSGFTDNADMVLSQC